jgi:hypothetical protein
MLWIIVLLVLALVSGVLGAIVESLLWLAALLFAAVAVGVLLRRNRGRS